MATADAQPRRRGWWTLARATIRNARRDRILGLGAEAGFWQLLSLPSLLLAVLGLIGFFGGSVSQDTLDDIRSSILHAASHLIVPSAVNSTVAPAVDEILAHGRPDVVTSTFIVSLWTGSSAMACYVNTITIAYGMRHLRGTVRSRLLALGLYFGFVLVDVVLLPLLVVGPHHLVDLFPNRWQNTAHDVVSVGYWPTVAIIGLALLTTLYHLALPVRIPWRRALPGAMLALAVWVSGSLLLRLWLGYSFRRHTTYGALASPVAVLLFLYLLAVAVLLGAELNAEIDLVWPLAITEGAREADARATVS